MNPPRLHAHWFRGNRIFPLRSWPGGSPESAHGSPAAVGHQGKNIAPRSGESGRSHGNTQALPWADSGGRSGPHDTRARRLTLFPRGSGCLSLFSEFTFQQAIGASHSLPIKIRGADAWN